MTTSEPRARPVRILLVEDNPGDVRLVRQALKASSFDIRLTVVEDGAEAVARLTRDDPHAATVRPDLVLLDLDLPGLDGHAVLAAIKTDPRLHGIPVCVLTSSADRADVVAAYEAQANAYVTKPRRLDDFLETVAEIERFWLSTAALPL